MGKIHEYYALIDKLEAMFQGKLTENKVNCWRNWKIH